MNACVAACLLVMTAGCSSDDATKPKPSPSPPGFDAPAGVTIAEGGSTFEVGKPASVVYQLGERATSAITVTVKDIIEGDIKEDFTFFSLDDDAKTSTPYYVKLTVENEGPSGLGGVAIPVLAHTESDTVFPPSELVGEFKPCRQSALPKSFLKGSTADLCLVYLLPNGEKLRSIDLQTGTEADAIHWRP